MNARWISAGLIATALAIAPNRTARTEWLSSRATTGSVTASEPVEHRVKPAEPLHASTRKTSEATREQVAWMTRVTSEVRARFERPVGLNLLENDAGAMVAIASASGADFIRVKIYVGAMMTPFGLETGKAHEAIKARNALAADRVAIFADVHDRTGMPIASGGFVEDVEFAVRLGGADGLVLTGKSFPETLTLIRAARGKWPTVPILVGGGIDKDNFCEAVALADGAIVSTSLKASGSAVGPFVPEKVKEFMTNARRPRPSI